MLSVNTLLKFIPDERISTVASKHTTTQNAGRYDVIIIGGGPAGATTAITLAQKKLSVLLLERAVFPRFHIGESLLPYMTRLLEQMGLLEKIKQQRYVPKWGAEFCGGDGDFRRIDFTDQGPEYIHYAFQVERAHFDNVLLESAKEAGVNVLEHAQVIRPLLAGERIVGVEYEYQGQIYREEAAYVVDASGRAGTIANYFKLRKPITRRKMIGIFRHLGDFNEKNNPGYPGDIQVGNHSQGWIWAIPVKDDVISIRHSNTRRISQGFFSRRGFRAAHPSYSTHSTTPGRNHTAGEHQNGIGLLLLRRNSGRARLLPGRRCRVLC